MKTTIIIILIFTFPFISHSQETTPVYPRFILKYSPISLLNIETPMIQFAGESFIKKNISLQYEVGFFSDRFWINKTVDLPAYSAIAIRGRAEVRKYKNSILDINLFNWYQGGGIQIKQMNQNYDKLFCPTEIQGPCITPLVFRQVRDIETITGIYYTIGGQYFLSKNWVIDVGGSMGLVVKSKANVNYPSEMIDYYYPFRRLYLWPNFNLKMGYSF